METITELVTNAPCRCVGGVLFGKIGGEQYLLEQTEIFAQCLPRQTMDSYDRQPKSYRMARSDMHLPVRSWPTCRAASWGEAPR